MQNGSTAFVDTNVLLYAQDPREPGKQAYWDALMVAAAQQQGCATLLTEDLHHGLQVDQLQVINPFYSRPDGSSTPR